MWLLAHLGAFLSCAALAEQTPRLEFRHHVDASSNVVYLKDVYDTSSLPAHLKERADAIELLSIPQGKTTIVIDQRRIAERARGALPALSGFLPSEASEILIERRAAPSPLPNTPSAPCSRVLKTINPGEAPVLSDLRPSACGAEPAHAPFRYDAATRTLIAERRLEADSIIYSPPQAMLAEVRQGQKLSLSIRLGAVSIERDAVIVRPSRRGQPFLVRTTDGTLFAAPPLVQAP